jgi:hypothetical protein
MSRDPKTSAIACALAASDYKERLAWIEELNKAALRHYRRVGARIELAYDLTATARVQEFVRLEQECCPFLEFAVHEGEHEVVLVIEAPEDAREAADVLFGSYTSRGVAT